MSELTYGYVPSYDFSALSNAAQAGYNFVLDEVLGLTRPLDYNFSSSPLIAQAQSRLDTRAQRLCALSSAQPNLTTPQMPLQGATRLPVGQGPMLNHASTLPVVGVNSMPLKPMPLITSQVLVSPQTQAAVQTAAPIVRQTLDLLSRAELSVTRAQTIRPQAAPLPIVQEQLNRVDQAIEQGDDGAALAAAQEAARHAAALEAELAQAGAQHMAQARRAADALARAGGLWTALHAQESLRQQADAAQLGAQENALHACREAYADGRFNDVIREGARLEANLSQLLEATQHKAALATSESARREIELTLRDLGFEVRAAAHAGQNALGAWRGGRELMTITFDSEGGFTVDTRHFAGAPSCSVETGKFLQELSRRLKFEVEERKYVAGPGAAPGQVARTRTSRRRLSLGNSLDEAARRSHRASVPPQAVAAWARITR